MLNFTGRLNLTLNIGSLINVLDVWTRGHVFDSASRCVDWNSLLQRWHRWSSEAWTFCSKPTCSIGRVLVFRVVDSRFHHSFRAKERERGLVSSVGPCSNEFRISPSCRNSSTEEDVQMGQYSMCRTSTFSLIPGVDGWTLQLIEKCSGRRIPESVLLWTSLFVWSLHTGHIQYGHLFRTSSIGFSDNSRSSCRF